MMAIGLVGTAISAIGTFSQMQAQAEAAEYQAQVAENNAQLAREQSAADARDQDRRGRRQLGRIRAAYGASGQQFAGSALDLYGDQVLELELEQAKIHQQGDVRATGFENEAELRRAEADSFRSAGILGAAGSVVSGAGSTLMRAF